MDIVDELIQRHRLAERGGAEEMRALSLGWNLVDGLASARERSGLTQTKVAERMGTSQASVAKLESHTHDPRLSTLMRYIAALGDAGASYLDLLERRLEVRESEPRP